MRDKKKTKNIKVRDLKPKKDAKGGMVAQSSHQTQSHGIQSPGTKYGVK